MATRIEEKLVEKTAVAGILGLGYVGIPLARSLTGAGVSCIGFDINPHRVDQLMSGQSPIKHIDHAEIARMRDAGFQATTDFARAAECDALLICVPTPLTKSREPDLSFVVDTIDALAPHLRAGQMISLESTTWPGTSEEVILPRIEKLGFTVGKDFHLVYSPEREDPGNPEFHGKNTPKVVGGHTPACLQAGSAFYGAFIDHVVPVSSTRTAELVKLLENIYRSVNIGLVNEMKVLADRMGLDIFEVINAAATKPFGFKAFYPGPGIGGHCIPVDPFYLTWKAREYGLHTRFIELAGEINAHMPRYVVDRLLRGLSERGKALSGSRILALGIAYKRDVDDMRESPSVYIMEILRDWGAEVAYSDPNVPVFPQMREHSFDLESVALTPDTVGAYDAVLLLTDHTDFDYDMIVENAQLLIDTRGKFPDSAANVLRA